MKPVLLTGICIVNLALICYSIAIIKQTRSKQISRNVLRFLIIGLCFDITATILMIIGSSKGIITLHGCIGYSSLSGMLVDTILSYRQVKRHGLNTTLSIGFNRFSLIAYFYWIAAYITGSVLVMMR